MFGTGSSRTYISGNIKTREIVNSKENKFDNVASKHEPTKYPKVPDIDSFSPCSAHCSGDGPVGPVVRENENHGHNFAIYESIDDCRCDESGRHKHRRCFNREWLGDRLEWHEWGILV